VCSDAVTSPQVTVTTVTCTETASASQLTEGSWNSAWALSSKYHSFICLLQMDTGFSRHARKNVLGQNYLRQATGHSELN